MPHSCRADWLCNLIFAAIAAEKRCGKEDDYIERHLHAAVLSLKLEQRLMSDAHTIAC